MRALFVGRFQPFHNGHELALKKILSENDEVIIAIGSTQENYTLRNPLTAGERIEMIWRYLKANNLLDRAIIVSVPDINNNAVWPTHVQVLAPKFDVVYSGNKLVQLLFSIRGVPVREIQEINREEFCGTVIRNKIKRGLPWSHLVPRIIYEFLEEINFEERIRRLL